MKLLFILALCLAMISAGRNRTEKPSEIDLKNVDWKKKMEKYSEPSGKVGGDAHRKIELNMLRKAGFDATKLDTGDSEE